MYSEMIRQQREALVNIEILNRDLRFYSGQLKNLNWSFKYYSERIDELTKSGYIDEYKRIRVQTYAARVESLVHEMNGYNEAIKLRTKALEDAKMKLAVANEWLEKQKSFEKASFDDPMDNIMEHVNRYGYVYGTKL